LELPFVMKPRKCEYHEIVTRVDIY
jgi:hypothetical protein